MEAFRTIYVAKVVKKRAANLKTINDTKKWNHFIKI